MITSPLRPSGNHPTSPGSRKPHAFWSNQSVWGISALLFGSVGLDWLYLGHIRPMALVYRLLVLASLLIMRELHARPSTRVGRGVQYVSLVVSSGCIIGLVHEMGGLDSPFVLVLPIMPLSIALLFGQNRRATFVSGVMGSLGTWVLVLLSHRPFIEGATWLMIMVGVGALADVLCRQALYVHQAEQQVRIERSRREALEALALSEHRRAQSEKLAIVGRLASGVAHEINNPLAYVGSNVDFVREELLASVEVDREALAEVLSETRVGVQHIQQIVSDLKGFSRMDTHESVECCLADVVADAMKLASLKLKHVAWLRVDVPATLPPVIAVRQRLVQVVLNLLVNAADVLDAHGVQGAEVRVTGRAEDACVVLLVEDNGPGFAPHVLPRLFEAFFTTKGPDKGTGLGLNLSRELVVQFGGTLTASNRAEGGARLRISLPIPSELLSARAHVLGTA
ncbi:sensor histidine kinase [Melittangium boletus]|uniref:histidine kinase n=1 Tax=Melittangium boletus DSM 14713 TaxID=1294270 RepID=A0A250IKW2_9BACT|nr:ATP-binding protein [Melittangium boletus]ATB32405.1 two-component sensor histidine kinase [Melittangium boletus DSM 14713]